MKFPIDKYRFYISGNKVIAVSSYAGKTVKGVAKCHETDTFDLEKGIRLAAARCAVRIANKRFRNSTKKMADAKSLLENAQFYYDKMSCYCSDSYNALLDAENELKDIIGNM